MMNNIQPSTTNHQPPTHVAIIMDGNGRWAKARGLPRVAGHKKGADSLRAVLKACRGAGVRYLTVYAFSSENWKRSREEIGDLMQLLQHYLQHELESLHENHIRLRFIGDRARLDGGIRAQIEEAESLTARNAEFHLTVALSYGSREEMVRAVRKLAGMPPETITEDAISAALDTAELPEPDLLIRTGGEQRLSNFLLWQSAYAELYFTDTLWPDFTEKDFTAALESYAGRERRFGAAG